MQNVAALRTLPKSSYIINDFLTLQQMPQETTPRVKNKQMIMIIIASDLRVELQCGNTGEINSQCGENRQSVMQDHVFKTKQKMVFRGFCR